MSFTRDFRVLQLPKKLIYEMRVKMMLKKFRCLVLVMALILVFVSCTTFAAKKPIKLIMGSYFTGDHFYVRTDQYFKELVEKKSKGQILIDYFPSSQLGNHQEMMQAVKSGAQHLIAGGSPVWYCPELNTLELPYLYRDEAHLKKVASKFTSLINQKDFLAKTGTHILGTRLISARNLCTKFPVNKLEDIKGLKVRVPQSPMFLAMWKALGAIPTVISGSEQYTALATGVVDAAENPYPDIYMWKYYEILKYCALTEHIRSIYVVLINNNYWNSLTAAQQRIIKNATDKSGEYCERLRKEDEAKYKKILADAGMKFTTPDRAPFREKARVIWGQFGNAELIKKIDALK
jgi:tripartite ATP-independent transporter DctP family solute receptor